MFELRPLRVIDDHLDRQYPVVGATNGHEVSWPTGRSEFGVRVPETKPVPGEIGYLTCD